MKLKIFNTLTRKKEEFKSNEKGRVGLYTCGPTVYNYAHIGNLRTYIFEDVLKRALLYNGNTVNHIMNITDVGHLTDDADEGEDKLEKAAKKENKSAVEIAEFYTNAFKKDLEQLNILPPTTWCKATDHIKEQIEMVEKLLKDGFAYETKDTIYFDTTKDKNYGDLANLKNQELQAGKRVEIGDKKNIHDFALWKFSKPEDNRQMEWEAFGKMGFPGWHLECSAMSIKYLGENFDIHCGGVDHIPVHHTNEIAQSTAFTGKKPVNVWMHGEFLLTGKVKMAKSRDNFLTLEVLKEKGFSPLTYRYFLLQAHYRKQLNFSWEALEAAQNGLEKLQKAVTNLGEPTEVCNDCVNKFLNIINDDLNTPQALALVWELLKSDSANGVKKATILKFDKVLGLGLENIKIEEIPTNIKEISQKREQARKEKNWEESDKLRKQIEELGFSVEDTTEEQKISKK
ncbi:MAG: cysteine--tRNA ligase [Candidatus Magasanikbacteria bacterium]|nr:cysteine--tRNA ligase [Candidatus Magasanikbacteria bacterium]